MGNEIKFRWVGRNRKFGDIQINNGLTTSKLLTGEVLSFFNKSNCGANGNCEFLSEDLFSGIQDKNGVDIYENDLLRDIGRVVFNDGCFLTGYGVPIIMSKHNLEIIGTVYGSPELLETK